MTRNQEFAVIAEPETASKSAWKNPFLYSSLLLLLVALYVGYILFSRRESQRQFERRASEQQAEQRREDDRRAVEQLGGTELAVRALYLSPTVVHPNQPAQLCYDVSNAKSVVLDPPVAEVWPSHSRCLELKAKKTTTYTLTITDASGKSVSQSVDLQVR